jgi:hypothetical protein
MQEQELMNELVIVAIIVIAVGGTGFYIFNRAGKAKKGKEAVPVESAPRAALTRVLPVGMLIAKSGVHRGMVFVVEPSGIKIGRDKSKNGIVIDSEIVSREHAWIGLEDGRVVIKDLGSRNGTYINSLDGARIQTVVLKDSDVIFIGKNGVESFKYKSG